MNRDILAVLFSASLLALPALAQEKTEPARPPAPAKPAARTLAGKPNVVAPAAKPVRPPSQHASEVLKLSKRQRQLAQDLVRMRAKISKEHPELGDKMDAVMSEAMKLRKQAALLARQARELKKKSNEMMVNGRDTLFGEVDPAFAVKRKELAEVSDQFTKLRAKARQEQHKRRQEEARQFSGKQSQKPSIRPATPPAPGAPVVPAAPAASKAPKAGK
ncbi:MAG: hypothetical protein HN849_05760 [Victivallales bacterium]|jgi:hypothetical protein|nr:hypothetical protein [Victivallales bacterium]MBT7298993.1 hypothetical protein [Victivallales bacterium]